MTSPEYNLRTSPIPSPRKPIDWTAPHPNVIYESDEDEDDDENGNGDEGGSDSGSEGEMNTISIVEAAQGVWGPRSKWFLFIGIGLSAYIYSLESVTTWQYLSYATSDVLEHSLSGTIATGQAIVIAVGKPLMAKLADVVGRGETFIIVTILYVLGYLVIASSDTIHQIALGEILYAFGYTGLQMLQLIVIADMTSLRWRGLVTGLVSAPFIVNNFISAEIAQSVLPDWRWGYTMFAILIPIFLAPIIIALMWAQWQAKRLQRVRYRSISSRGWWRTMSEAAYDMDFIGLLLISASLALLLLPMGLAPSLRHNWWNPSMMATLFLGLLLVPVFVIYELRIPAKPAMPLQWLRRGPILGACLIGFFDFVSFYLQYTYLYSYVYVTRNWTYRNLTYFSSTQSLVMTVFGIIGGGIMYASRRFKYMLFTGLLFRLLGVTYMLQARTSTGTALSLITCQILQGIGGGLAAISIQVSAQASVSHLDVATVTAMVLLISEVGNSVGSATAAGIWATYMPGELKENVPGASGNETLLKELYGSILDIGRWEWGDPVREGVCLAYQNVMYRLVLASIFVALFPPILCLIFTQNIHLSRAQNAIDGKDAEGRPVVRSQPVQGRVRLNSRTALLGGGRSGMGGMSRGIEGEGLSGGERVGVGT